LSFGEYPHVDLKYAREQREDAFKELARGIDPSAKRRAEADAASNTFESVSKLWLAAGCPSGRRKTNALDEKTIELLRRRLEKYVWPYVGALPIRSVEVANFRALLDRIAKRGTLETADRVLKVGDRVFRWAIGKELADRNPAADLRGTLPRAKTRNFAAITDAKKFGELLRTIDAYPGQPPTRAALQVLALTFVRPGELRQARWSEFELEGRNPHWVVPGSRTKTRKPHIVPLSKQSLEVLKDLQLLTLKTPESFVFPSLRPTRPLSENTLNMALRSMGYGSDQHVGHGFRSSASSMLHELGYAPETIEAALAHSRPGVAGIYNRSHLLPQRRKLMNAWGRYCADLKAETSGSVARPGAST
jgi:integrase